MPSERRRPGGACMGEKIGQHRAMRARPRGEVEHARDFAAALISDGLLVALHEHGWSVEAPPAGDWSGFMRRLDAAVTPSAAAAANSRW